MGFRSTSFPPPFPLSSVQLAIDTNSAEMANIEIIFFIIAWYLSVNIISLIWSISSLCDIQEYYLSHNRYHQHPNLMDGNLDFIRNCPGKHNLVCKPCFLIHYKDTCSRLSRTGAAARCQEGQQGQKQIDFCFLCHNDVILSLVQRFRCLASSFGQRGLVYRDVLDNYGYTNSVCRLLRL